MPPLTSLFRGRVSNLSFCPVLFPRFAPHLHRGFTPVATAHRTTHTVANKAFPQVGVSTAVLGSGDDDDYDEEEERETKRFRLFAKMEHPEIVRNVGTSLLKFTNPGSFATSGFLTTTQPYGTLDSMALCMSGCRIDGMDVTFPITADTINMLQSKGVLTAAPFGKGTETVLDPTVRKTLQIEPQHITFSNPAYPAALQTLARRVARSLGLSNAVSVHANLHKMLIYQPGDFFTTHRDSVHEPNMIGTLVVQPPSKYTGGKLVVTHGTSTHHLDISDPEIAPFAVGFTAFYADCEHSIEMLKSGVRVVFAYNLVSGTPCEMPTTLPDGTTNSNNNNVDALHAAVQTWYDSVKEGSRWHVPVWSFSKSTSPILVCVCEHLYTKSIASSLDPLSLISALKGADQSRFLALAQVLAKLGLTKKVGLGIAFLNGHMSRNRNDRSRRDRERESFSLTTPMFGDEREIPDFSIISSQKYLTEAENAHLFHVPFAEYVGNGSSNEEHTYQFSAIVMWDLSKTYLIMHNMLYQAKATDVIGRILQRKTLDDPEERRDFFRFAFHVQMEANSKSVAIAIMKGLDWLDCHKQFEALIRQADHANAVKGWLQFLPVEMWDTKLKYLSDCKMWLFEDGTIYEKLPLKHLLAVAQSLDMDGGQSFVLTHAVIVNMAFDALQTSPAKVDKYDVFDMVAVLLERGNVNDPLFPLAVESITRLEKWCHGEKISASEYGKYIEEELDCDKARASLATKNFMDKWIPFFEKHLDDTIFTWTEGEIMPTKPVYRRIFPFETIRGFGKFVTGPSQQFVVKGSHMDVILSYCTQNAFKRVKCASAKDIEKGLCVCEKQKEFGLERDTHKTGRAILEKWKSMQWTC